VSFKERVTFSQKSLVESLGIWGLFLLALLAVILTIVASVIGSPEQSEFPFQT
jgi:hypothetical protein